jgi:type VI protein secretion system component Hcp
MAWSNIFLQLITGTGPGGAVPMPVIGEGLLEGWETSIELESFSWGCSYKQHGKKEGGSALGGLAGAVSGALGLGGKNVHMDELTLRKRFDIASSQIHFCVDRNLPVISASITVLNIKQGGRAIHEPGFTLVATDGRFTDVKLSMQASGNAVEVKEEITLKFNSIVVTYLKRVGKDNLPTNPFFYTAPTPKKSLPGL